MNIGAQGVQADDTESERIKGRTVLITGAASGIGQALARGFLADGARVVGVDREAAGLEAIAAEGASTLVCDVTSDLEVRAAVAFAIRETGRLDVLFNNAGIGGREAIETLADDQFEAFIRVHVFATLYGLRAAMPVMRAQQHGRIINTLSRGAEARAPGWASYAAGKAGALALTRVAAAEAKADGVLVNGMIPGPTLTGMNSGPDLQPPEAVYPGARWLAALPADGPTGKVFWNRQEYRLFEKT